MTPGARRGLRRWGGSSRRRTPCGRRRRRSRCGPCRAGRARRPCGRGGYMRCGPRRRRRPGVDGAGGTSSSSPIMLTLTIDRCIAKGTRCHSEARLRAEESRRGAAGKTRFFASPGMTTLRRRAFDNARLIKPCRPRKKPSPPRRHPQPAAREAGLNGKPPRGTSVRHTRATSIPLERHRTDKSVLCPQITVLCPQITSRHTFLFPVLSWSPPGRATEPWRAGALATVSRPLKRAQRREMKEGCGRPSPPRPKRPSLHPASRGKGL